MLRSRAQQLQPERLPLLHRRASSWYVQQGLIGEAVEHALAAGDMEQAAGLVEQIAQATFLRGEVRTLLGWLSALPEAIVHARPRLSLAHAWALDFTGHVDAAEAQLQDVGQDMQQQATAADRPLLGGAAAALQAFVAGQRGDVPGMMALAQQALAFDSADTGEPRSLSLLALGNAHFFNGDLAAAHQTLATVIATRQVTGDLFATMLAIYILADVELHQGQLQPGGRAAPAGAAAWQLDPMGSRCRSPVWPTWRWARSCASGMSWMRRCTACGPVSRWRGSGASTSCWWIARLRWRGCTRRVVMAMARSRCSATSKSRCTRHGSPPGIGRSSPPVGRGCGWRRGSARWPASGPQDYAARLEADAPNLRPLVKYAFAHTTLARVRLAEGQPEEAVQLLTRLLAVAEAGGWMGDVIEILALQALALQMQGATAQALTHPRDARWRWPSRRGMCASSWTKARRWRPC